jgi:hypothetical protein
MSHYHTARLRYLPLAVLAVALLKSKIYFRNVVKAVSRRAIALLRRAKQRFFSRPQQPQSSLDLATVVEKSTDPVPMLDIEIRFGRSLTAE